MTARARADAAWQTQGLLVCEGMAPDVIDEGNMADVFQLWADRIAEVNAVCAASELACDVCGRTVYWCKGHAELTADG